MESSYHVFVLKEVNTCFTSHTAVNLRQKCSRNLNKINPSQVSGSSETGQITYNTAAQRNQQTFSVHFIFNQSFI